MKKVPIFDMTKCARCNICVNTCTSKAISVISNSCCAKCIKYCIPLPVPCHPEYLIFDYYFCDSCGQCIDKCPNGAIYWIDRENALLKKIEQQ